MRLLPRSGAAPSCSKATIDAQSTHYISQLLAFHTEWKVFGDQPPRCINMSRIVRPSEGNKHLNTRSLVGTEDYVATLSENAQLQRYWNCNSRVTTIRLSTCSRPDMLKIGTTCCSNGVSLRLSSK
jgi:hypothetical protein